MLVIYSNLGKTLPYTEVSLVVLRKSLSGSAVTTKEMESSKNVNLMARLFLKFCRTLTTLVNCRAHCRVVPL